jgi:hypothetical protein
VPPQPSELDPQTVFRLAQVFGVHVITTGVCGQANGELLGWPWARHWYPAPLKQTDSPHSMICVPFHDGTEH